MPSRNIKSYTALTISSNFVKYNPKIKIRHNVKSNANIAVVLVMPYSFPVN